MLNGYFLKMVGEKAAQSAAGLRALPLPPHFLKTAGGPQLAFALAVLLGMAVLAACGGDPTPTPTAVPPATSTPVPPPRPTPTPPPEAITATEVTDRTTLRAFVEDAKRYLEGVTTVTGIARLRDAFRAEGRWKSGSLFLTTMTQDGNILIHGNDPTAENKRVVAVEDERGRPVGQELLAAAERGGDFVDYRWDGTDRVAYAVYYASGLTDNTLVVIGGFAQDLSSVPVEFTPLPRPEVTAAEVVDRQTLATFVEAAAKQYRDATLSPNLRGLADTKTAFRQEGGDWKSGSVYIFVASTDGYTLFHGGFPHRYEGRQFEDIDREDVNGVRYIREILAAGEAGGGYVEYMFDNPAVEGDEETGSPKITYATGFRLPGQEQVFVVGSGFYPDE